MRDQIPSCPRTIHLELPAKVKELDQVVDPLRAGLIAYGCTYPAVDRVVVAVEELFVNIAHYAYGGESGPARLTYEFDAPDAHQEAGVTIILEDEGAPFDPVAKPDPVMATTVEEAKIGGLGIFMAKKSVDVMSYERIGDTNKVTLIKRWQVED